MKINKIRELYKRFVESETFKEVYKDKSVGEQMKIEDWFFMEKKEPKKEYNKSQCVYGPNSTMPCMLCSALCKERYEDFKYCGIKVAFI